jgi:Na+-transporting methylmalonyl-CoA/oxaloacetate decarboxylase gamma subunit
MIEINLSIQNILDGHGLEISIIGMLVVFTALTLISSFISLLPSVLRVVNFIYPIKDSSSLSERSDIPKDEVLAAIGSALHAAEIGK